MSIFPIRPDHPSSQYRNEHVNPRKSSDDDDDDTLGLVLGLGLGFTTSDILGDDDSFSGGGGDSGGGGCSSDFGDD